MLNNVFLMSFLSALYLTSAFAETSCPNLVPSSFTFLKSEKGQTFYLHQNKRVVLSIQCFKNSDIKAVSADLGTHFDVRRKDANTLTYFSNLGKVFTRTYMFFGEHITQVSIIGNTSLDEDEAYAWATASRQSQ